MAQSHRARIISGRCTEGDAAPAYQPIVEALTGPLASINSGDVADIARPVAPVLLAMLPALALRLDPSAAANQPKPDRFTFFEAVGSIFRALAAESGLLLCIEDLRWADTPTLLLLEHLIRQSADARLPVAPVGGVQSHAAYGLGDARQPALGRAGRHQPR